MADREIDRPRGRVKRSHSPESNENQRNQRTRHDTDQTSNNEDRNRSNQRVKMEADTSVHRQNDNNSNRGAYENNRGYSNRGRNENGRGGHENNQRGGYESNRGENHANNRGGYESNRGENNNQRGGYENNRGSYDNNSRRSNGHNPRGDSESNRGENNGQRGDHANERGGYDNNSRRSNGHNPRGDSESSRGGYNNQRGGYESNRGGYDNNRGGNESFNDRGGRGGGRGGGGGRDGYNGGGPPSEPHVEGPINLMTNFFEVKCLDTDAEWILYQYHVTFEPDIQSKACRGGLLKEHYDRLFRGSKAFDGTTIYSMVKLPEKQTMLTSKTKRDEMVVNIKLDLVKEIHPGDDQTIQIFNSIFKRCLKKCNYVEYGKERAYFDFSNGRSLGQYNLEVFSGFKASIEIYGERLLLCTEIANKLVNKNSVLDVLNQIYQDTNAASYKEAVETKLIGQTVMTNYNKKTYKVDDINWEGTPLDVFETKKDGPISFVDYYKKYYSEVIKTLKQPLLVSRPKKRDLNRGDVEVILLVPELCAVTGQSLMDPRNFSMKKDLDNITKLGPEVRFKALNTFLRNIKSSEAAKEDFNNWQMNLADSMLQVTGTVLKQTRILFGNDQALEKTVNGWDNEIKTAQHIKTIDLNNWWILFVSRDQKKAELLQNKLPVVANSMGFRVDQPIMRRLPDSREAPGALFMKEINYRLQKSKPQLILCVLPSNDKTAYNSIKRTCCIEADVPSQVVTQKILDENKLGKTMSVITKVAIQMNCKLGGEIWGIRMPCPKIMVVGMDLYKDSQNRNQSAFAFVASMNNEDRNCSRYFSRVIMQGRNDLFATGLQMLMRDALEKYQQKNNLLPDKILIYRDGASDAQLKLIREEEVDKQIKVAFKQFPGYSPKIACMVVQKRGNTRFFRQSANGEYVNAPMGTCVDNTITGRKINRLRFRFRRGEEELAPVAEATTVYDEMRRDFYLVSQSVKQGTVSPSHFRIILDEFGIKDAQFQKLTFDLTHMYYNWPGQIRVPAPCHYAQKLAHLVGESLHENHHPGLDDLLFYL